ncbi:MAG: magnesium-translocating P-type ATPase [Patescibacteria group bacterium]|jgi:Mg2+-importing ATPase
MINEEILTTGRSQAQSEYFRLAGLGIEELFKEFSTSANGLNSAEAESRLRQYGYNEPAKKKTQSLIVQVVSKLLNPLILILLVIIFFSLFFGEMISAIFVSVMILISVSLDSVQEYKSDKAVEKLNDLVRTKVEVHRAGEEKEIDIKELVPGDVVDLFAGNMIPADIRIFSSKDLFINQASLTGESFPVEKTADISSTECASLTELPNMAFMGSNVVSGTALGLVLRTGQATQFGEISKTITSATGITSFDKGVRQFTMLMIRLIVILSIAIFFIIFVLKHGFFKDALLFSLAVAVGLTPEMLPMIVTINLSKGAVAMAKKKVIVKKLNAIQNLGAMDILCTDKTGTLTMAKIILETHCDVTGKEDEGVLKYAYLVSSYQTGLKNIIDQAILNHEKLVVNEYEKIDEIPFDFARKVMSVVTKYEEKYEIICKGAPEEVYKKCTRYELDGKLYEIDDSILTTLKKEYDKLSSNGFMVLAVARNEIAAQKTYSKNDESDLILIGYMAFLDPAKPSASNVLAALKEQGVEVKILTGDNELVTRKICNDVGLTIKGVLLGTHVDSMDDAELQRAVDNNTILARLAPLQKERVIRALQRNGHTVGYLGDGINDAPSLKASDVGISVNNAVDIAKESADMILLEKDLMVIEDGVIEGRKTFGNITKYIKMSASSNFGNMLSMTGATLFLPFLPMLPLQILLNNFLYDISQTSLPADDVDPEYLKSPRPWNIDFIRKYMIMIGPISSIFDFMTFAIMWFIFAGYTLTPSAQMLFHTGWFLESICSQILIIYVIRTNKIPFIESRPNKLVVITTLFVLLFAFTLPFTPLATFFGLVPPPALYFVLLAGMIASYFVLVQIVKTWVVKKFGYQ